MEVPGKQGTTLVCLPCDRDGLKEPAYGFCKDCQEHLCEACYKTHRRPRPLRNHVLLDKDSMPDTQKILPKIPDNNNDLCQIHPDKPLEFYCNDHKFVACYVCVTLKHKQCKVDYIPDISGNLTDEMNDMLQKMGTLVKKYKSNINDADMIIERIEQNYNEVVENIKLFRKEINEHLDRMEATIIGEANAIQLDIKIKKEAIKAVCEERKEELKCLHSLLYSLNEENKQIKLFIEMKNAEERLAILTYMEKQVLEENKTNDSIKFTRNTGFLHTLKRGNIYGHLSTYARPSPNRKIGVLYRSEIDVKSSTDSEKCSITGIAVPAPSKLIVVDYNNKCIKMINEKMNTVVSKIGMPSTPTDIITLPEDRFAVSLTREMAIQIVSYKEIFGFSLDRQIAVGETCNGLANYQDQIVVCCQESKKILLVNYAGDILSTIDKPDFYGPLRVVISKDEKFLYISDTDWSCKNRVVKIDWKGNVKNVFEEPGYNVPDGIQLLEDGSMLVYFRTFKTLVRLSSILEKYGFIWLMGTEIFSPKAIAYSDKTHKLYLTCSSKGWVFKEDVIKEFNIKWV